MVQSTQNLSLSAVSTLQQYAVAGLPVIVSGGSPGYYPQKDGRTKADFDVQLSTLMSTTNVHQAASGGVAELLFSLGLRPRVEASSNGTWYTTWRESAADDVDYALVYCDLAPASGEIVVASTKRPYLFDAWTGTRKPVLVYQQDNSTTTIPLSLAGNQTIVIAFSDKLTSDIPTPSTHIVSAPPSVIGASFDKTSGISLHVAGLATSGNVTISNGTSLALCPTESSPSFTLENWTLVAEHWEAPANLSDAVTVASKHNTTHMLPSLVPWTDIPGLSNASGVGYYTSRFQSPETNSSASNMGAYILLSGRILHTARLYVNGIRTPPLDLSNPKVDITPYMRAGENEVLISVATPMWNYLRTILAELLNAGFEPLPVYLEQNLGMPLAGTIETGLVGEVRVVPFIAHSLGL